MKSLYLKKNITYHHALTDDDLTKLTEIYLNRWQKVEYPSTFLHENPNQFRELFRDEIRNDLQIAMKKGICIYAKYEGRIIGFTAARDVNDIEMLPFEKPYKVKYEAYERVMNSFFTLMKNSHRRGDAIYLEFVTTIDEFEGTGLEESLTSVIGYTINNQGFKDVYIIPSNKEQKEHFGYEHDVVSEINLDNITFGEQQPFKGIDFIMKLIRIPISGNFASLFSKVNQISGPQPKL